MKNFPHKKFLEENKEQLKEIPLPELLQKRINGFDELHADLEHTIEEDRESMDHKLEMLSHELYEDLEEYLEEHLENNELEEKDEAKSEHPESTENSETSALTENNKPATNQDIKSMEQTEETAHSESTQDNPEVEPEKTALGTDAIEEEPTDEYILEEFLNAGNKFILPSELKAKNFKTTLSGRVIRVGKFLLMRGKYHTHYKIERI